MAKRSSKRTERAIALAAGIALVVGLLAAPALAAPEPAAAPGQQAPADGAPEAQGPQGAGPEAPEEGAAGAQAPAGEAAEPAAPAAGEPGNPGKEAPEEGAAGAEAPAGEAAEPAPPADEKAVTEAPAGGPEASPGEAAGKAPSPGEGGGGDAAPAGEPSGVAAAEGKREAAAEAAAMARAAGSPAFGQSRTVGGVTVTVGAAAGAFPKGATLSVAGVPPSRTEAAVAPERGEGESVAASYAFDIKVLDKDGKELQPAGGGPVSVSFSTAEVADPNLDVSVYHVPDAGPAEELPVTESGSTATAESDGFSYYTVEFTYGELRYVLPGDGEVALSEILSAVGLEGEPTGAASSAPGLFGVEERDGAWIVSARRAFSTTETLTVTVGGTEYAIAVTDAMTASGECGMLDDNLTWTFDGDSGTLTISGTGMMEDYWYLSGDYPGWYSIRNDISTIVIESGVTRIGQMAFYDCPSLVNVTFEDESQLVEIREFAFEGCSGLTSIKIPSGVSSIETHAFEGCSGLTSIKIPSGVTSIENSAFEGCSGLTSVEIPSGVTTIEDAAFEGCSGLTSVEIPSGVTSIGVTAFAGCSGLTSVEIPSGVTTIGGSAFSGCSGLSRVDYDGTLGKWDSIGKAGWAKGAPDDLVVVCKFDGTVKRSPEAGGRASAHVEVRPNDPQSSPTAIAEAEANGGYVFVCWTGEDGKTVSGDATFSFPAGAYSSLTANFKIPLTITAKDQSYTYDGKVHGEGDMVHEDGVDSKITAEGLRSGDRITVIEIFGQRKDAGKTDVEVRGCVVKRGDAEVTGEYDIAYVPGTLTVVRKAATVTTGSATKAYDGEPLTNPEAGIAGLVRGETATVKATGSRTEVGSSPNTYAIEWGSADKGNYAVTERLGTLTVEAAPVAEYTVTFEDWDGTVLQSGKVMDGELPRYGGDEPTRPSDDKYDYAFAGWAPEVIAATADATYTATYAATPKDRPEYEVTSGDGGTWARGSGEPLAFKIERSPDPGKAFGHFTGVEVDGKVVPERDASGRTNWAAESGSVVLRLQPSYLATLSTGEHALAATFDDGGPAGAGFAVVVTHRVTFDANGHGTAPAAQDVGDGEKASKPADPKADGWAFGGWYTDKACKQAYDFSRPVTSDLTLYAKWTERTRGARQQSKPATPATRTTSTARKTAIPRTGDGTPAAPALASIAAAGAALAAAGLARRRRG